MSDDLHPEELLSRAAAHPLRPEDAADLRAHLQRCPACALHVNLRGELDRAFAPLEADYEVGARAMERLLASGERALRPVATFRGARRGRAGLAARAALVLLMLAGTGVGAAVLVYRVREGRFPGATVPVSSAPPRAPLARAVPRTRASSPEAMAPVAPVAPPAVEIAPPLEPPPAIDVAPRIEPPPALGVARPRSGVRRGVAASPPEALVEPQALVEPPPAPIEQPPTAAPPVAVNGAALLFQAAQRARRSGDAAGAERLYARLADEFPGTREEGVARALRGQLLLDKLDRPAEALAAFEAYLRAQPDGALAEAARASRAEALGRLGRRREESAAWRELLAADPRSIYAARARERLAALADIGD